MATVEATRGRRLPKGRDDPGGVTSLAAIGTAVAILAAAGCTLPLKPDPVAIAPGSVPAMKPGRVEVVGVYSHAGDRVAAVPGGSSVKIDHDVYTTSVAGLLHRQLASMGAPSDSGVDGRRIEVQVVRATIQPQPSMSCVIDYNLRLGAQPIQGRQVRAENWSFVEACNMATSQVVLDILALPAFRAFVEAPAT